MDLNRRKIVCRLSNIVFAWCHIDVSASMHANIDREVELHEDRGVWQFDLHEIVFNR
jgi:hypothetical protein